MTISNSPSPSPNEPNQSRARTEGREGSEGGKRNEGVQEGDKCLSSLMSVNAALTATRGCTSLTRHPSLTFNCRLTCSHLAISYHSLKQKLTDDTSVEMIFNKGILLLFYSAHLSHYQALSTQQFVSRLFSPPLKENNLCPDDNTKTSTRWRVLISDRSQYQRRRLWPK